MHLMMAIIWSYKFDLSSNNVNNIYHHREYCKYKCMDTCIFYVYHHWRWKVWSVTLGARLGSPGPVQWREWGCGQARARKKCFRQAEVYPTTDLGREEWGAVEVVPVFHCQHFAMAEGMNKQAVVGASAKKTIIVPWGCNMGLWSSDHNWSWYHPIILINALVV